MASATARKLAYMAARRTNSAEAYLRLVSARHQALGFGQLATGKSKFSRWKAGVTPELPTQIAMADLEGLPAQEVVDRGWPGWLQLIVTEGDDHLFFDSPWTTAGTVTALEKVGAPVKANNGRRDFLILTAGGLGAMAANWASATPASAADTTRGRRIGGDRAAAFEGRLAALRRLDDQVGSGRVYTSAVTELQMITDTLRTASYSEPVGGRLFAAAAEASRSAGWTAYDSGRHATAERHFAAALRAAASAGDPVVGVNTLAFWAIQHYSTGDPRGAVALVEEALRVAPGSGRPG